MSFTQEELVDMIFILGECHQNPFLASRIYTERFPNRRHPQEASFRKLLERFRNSGHVQYPKKVFNNPVVHEENEFLVLGAVQENPTASVREISNTFDISKSSVHRILKKHRYHPYHVQLHQELLEGDFERRRIFCQWAVQKFAEDESFFKTVMFSDEATFHRNGFVNRHNYHYYADENPHYFRTTDQQHRWSLNVWAGILGNHVIGPVFFNGNLTGQTYLRFLTDELDDLLMDVPLATLRHMWLQQDGAPPHNTRQVTEFLNEHFPNRWIGLNGPVRWPARSPDLSKLDFFLWGFLKSKVYLTPPTTPEDMRNRIRLAFLDITPAMLINVEANFIKRVRFCLQQNGGHFEHLLE